MSEPAVIKRCAELAASGFEPCLLTEPYTSFRARAVRWASQYTYCAILDSCLTTVDRYGHAELVIGVGEATDTPVVETWDELEARGLLEQPGWFLALPYTLRHRFVPLVYPHSRLEPEVPLPPAHPIRLPEVLAFQATTQVIALSGDPGRVWLKTTGVSCSALWASLLQIPPLHRSARHLPEIPPVFTAPDGYQRRFTAVQQAEANGIVYEANLTVPYQTELTLPDPVADWWELIHRSPVPFAVFFAYRQWVVLGASPERLLRLDNHKLTTQPIKGTRKRVPSDPVADAQARNELVMSTKNRAENLMIADLARAELYRSAVRHSVWVPQLFEIQVFANLFHLVSTVRATLHPDVPPHVALRTVFPAGSMTGAPKFWVLRLLDEIEPHDRGLYAGSIGWTFPGGFDINVVIRSFVHDRLTSLLTYQVGGAITVYSDLEDEQAENDLKAHYLEHLFHS